MFRFSASCALASLFLFATPPARAADEESPNDTAGNLSTLGRRPDWSELEKYQGTITHDEFLHLLKDVYCLHEASPEVIRVEPESARILMTKGTQKFFVLRFARGEAERLHFERWWAPPAALPAQTAAGPLSGFHIALDPGHLGGAWAKMEERWFQIGDASAVQEGDMTLRVAQMLAPRLESLGAKVSLVREKAEPITPYRPSDLEGTALQFLHRAGIAEPRETYDGPADPHKEQTLQWQRELLFYRNSEIRKRGNLVNYRMQPDLVLCLHFNAEPWGDPSHPTLVRNNHLHLLVNGAYLPAELDYDDERFQMLEKLLSRSFAEELELAETLAQAMAKKSGLPPYHYKTDNVTPVGTSGYVYARNLMATRLYRCPTVYLEPYVMNSHEVFERVQAGDYEGTRKIGGVERPSIYREYVDGVVDGMLAYFKKTRP